MLLTWPLHPFLKLGKSLRPWLPLLSIIDVSSFEEMESDKKFAFIPRQHLVQTQVTGEGGLRVVEEARRA